MRAVTLLALVLFAGSILAPAQPSAPPQFTGDAAVAQRLLEEANDLSERKDYVAALKKLEDAFRALPADVRSHLDAAAKAAASADVAELRRHLQQANEGFESLPAIFYLTGTVRRRAGDIYGAIGAFDSALVISPQFVPALTGRAVAKEEIEDYEGALTDYNIHIAVGFRPGLEQVYFRRGLVHQKLGDAGRAEEDFRASIRTDPNYSPPYSQLGDLLRFAGKLEESVALCDKAIALTPEDPGPYNARLWTYHAMGRPEQAVADATKCMELTPDNGYFVVYRALLHELTGNREGAAKDYALAIDLAGRTNDQALWFYAHAYRDLLQRSRSEPTEASYLPEVVNWPDSWQKRLGLYLLEKTSAETLLGDAKHAKRRTEKLQQQCEANYFIGMVNLSRGKVAEAKQHLQQCLDLPVDMIERTLAAHQLKQLAKAGGSPAK